MPRHAPGHGTAHRPAAADAVPRSLAAVALIAALFLVPGAALAGKGTLEITSEPGGAKVMIDGKWKGTTPTEPGKTLFIELPEGAYRVDGVIETPPMKAGQDVYAAEGAIQPVKLVLTSAFAPVMVRIPSGSFFMGC